MFILNLETNGSILYFSQLSYFFWRRLDQHIRDFDLIWLENHFDHMIVPKYKNTDSINGNYARVEAFLINIIREVIEWRPLIIGIYTYNNNNNNKNNNNNNNNKNNNTLAIIMILLWYNYGYYYFGYYYHCHYYFLK